MMPTSFTYQTASQRILFGPGTIQQLVGEIDRLALGRVLFLSTPGGATKARALAETLGPRSAGVLATATMHTPVDVTEEACRQLGALRVDGLVALGGGSTIGLGKAIALRTHLPQIAIPTTYSGSEMTDLIGETRDGEKHTQRTEIVRPEVVIYDVDLTLDLPVKLSVTSAFNAMAHAVEALYAPDRNPVTSLMAVEAIGAIARGLPQLIERPDGPGGRTDTLYGAWLCGACLGAVTMGLHHKLAHVIGGIFNLPHAEMHTVLLPHALAYNAPSIAPELARVAAAIGSEDAVDGLRALQRACGAPSSLAGIGFPEDGIERVVATVTAARFANPEPISASRLREVLARAVAGT